MLENNRASRELSRFRGFSRRHLQEGEGGSDCGSPERPDTGPEFAERERFFQVTVCFGGPLPVRNDPTGPHQDDHHHLPQGGKIEHASQDGMTGHARQIFIQEREDGG
jgi:hypothetical protein